MNTARYGHTVSILTDRKVLITGRETNGGYLNSTELYHPSTGAWTITGSMNYIRSAHTACLLTNEKVLVAGGTDRGILNSSELYQQ